MLATIVVGTPYGNNVCCGTYILAVMYSEMKAMEARKPMGQSGLAVLVTPAHSSIVVDSSSMVSAVVNIQLWISVRQREIF